MNMMSPCPFAIGDEVEVIPGCADWASDWEGMQLFVAGIDYSGGGYEFTVSETWPPEIYALTDGFFMDVAGERNMLTRAQVSA